MKVYLFTRGRGVLALLSAIFLIGGVNSKLSAESASKPNVIMIMVDDMGWSDIAAYRRQQGLEFVPLKTPALDRLAAGGMMFTDAHSVAVVCAPTRFAMMTGSNPCRNGVFKGTWQIDDACAITVNRKHTTVGEVMQAAGYRTAYIGKMHLGGGLGSTTINTLLQKPIPDFPQSYGFDYSLVSHDGIQHAPLMYFENGWFKRVNPHHLSQLDRYGKEEDLQFITEEKKDVPTPNGFARIRSGLNDPNFVHSQNGIINTNHVVKFIRHHLEKHGEKPFMVYYCPPQMHKPNASPIDFAPDPKTGHPGSPPRIPVRGSTDYPDSRVADIIVEIDLHVAKILGALEDPNRDGDKSDSVLKNTLVMFTSDNGGFPGPKDPSQHPIPGYVANGVLRGAKGDQYEGGHRVPFIAHWGDGTPEGSMIKPASVSDAVIATHDWVATMYALTGTEIPSDQAMDSVNLMPLFKQEEQEVRDFLLLQAQEDEDSAPYMIRMGDYVLNMSSTGRNAATTHDETLKGAELYNLKEDLSQKTNLLEPSTHVGGEVPSKVAEIVANMLETYKRYNNENDPRSTPAGS